MDDIPIKLCECGCGEPTPLARKTSTKYGWVKGEPLRFIHGHNRRKAAAEYLIDPVTGCWIWQRGMAYAGGGYGLATSPNHGNRTKGAHVVMYERHKGRVPPGMHLHHTCHTPRCVNPDHLEPKTPTAHGRLKRNITLTPEQVQEIRAAPRGYGTGRVLAAKYGVSAAQISRIRLNQTWRE